MSEIKALLFDFGGTLDSDGVDWFSRLYQGVQIRCAALDRELFFSCADKAANRLCDFEDTKTLSMDRTVLRLCELIFEELAQKEPDKKKQWSVTEVAEEFFTQATHYLQRNREVLKALSDHYRLGCISNNWGNTAGWCAQFQLNDLFEVMVDSELVGAAKPDERIFTAALEQLHLSAQACAYVGDRLDCDVQGAQAAGMKTVWITNGNYVGPVDDSIASPRITKLPELLTLSW